MQKKLQLKPLLPFLFILIFMLGAYLFAYLHPPSWESLRQFHLSLKNFDEQHPYVTPLLFMGIYILYALFSLPGIFILSLLAGFLFVQPFSTLYVTFAATIGAALLFLVARTAFGELLYRRSGPFLGRLEKGFQNNAVSYLLFLRFLPLFPFWVVNLAGAFFGVSFWGFVWTTFVGMIPSVFIYTQAGRGLTYLLEQTAPLTPTHMWNSHLVMALVGLALLSLLPIVVSRGKAKSETDEG
jgi:uncharacterized membrane protein YdjX (TVP38/TMEM64 family)